MDMHGEMGPIADKMSKAMSDAPAMQQRMVRPTCTPAPARPPIIHTYMHCGASIPSLTCWWLVKPGHCHMIGRRRYVYGEI